MSQSGSAVVVTGAGRGIGRAVALAFALAGHALVLGARTLTEVEQVARECAEHGASATAVGLDVTQAESCEAIVSAALEKHGRIGVLVNNAGGGTSQKFTETDDGTWNRTLGVNLTGVFYMTRAALPSMLADGCGRVIAIASMAGKSGAPYIAAYSAAKHGVLGLTRSLAAEYANSGVTFNCICPAYVDTPMTDRTIKNIMDRTGRTRQEALKALVTPQGRLITPEEVADLCVYLASPSADGINGQAINIDGGMAP